MGDEERGARGEWIAALRRDYTRAGLDEADLGDDPVAEIGRWIEEAVALDLPEATAAILATADREGRPSGRVVLLKGYGPGGFDFFTNYESRKARELEENPRGCLVFYWPALERQVRIAGAVERLPADLSDAYFASRPRGSRLGAWASPQSRPLADRAELEARLAEIEERFTEKTVPRPPHWGGYRLRPEEIELWQGRASRLHDRFRFRRATPEGPWERVRLAP